MGILCLRDHLNVPYKRRGITADTALRFASGIHEDEFSKKISQDVRFRDQLSIVNIQGRDAIP